MSSILRFELQGEPNPELVEDDVALALLAAEYAYGKPRIRLEAAYLVTDNGKTCLIQVGGEAGEVAARIFAGLISAHYGEDSFRVERTERAGAVR